MKQPPLRNLPPEAEPYGRWVQDELIALDRDFQQTRTATDRALATTDVSLRQLGVQVNQITTLTQENITSSFFAGGVNPGFGVLSTPQTLVSVSVPIPAGAKSALMFANTVFYAQGPATASTYANMKFSVIFDTNLNESSSQWSILRAAALPSSIYPRLNNAFFDTGGSATGQYRNLQEAHAPSGGGPPTHIKASLWVIPDINTQANVANIAAINVSGLFFNK